MPEIQVGQSAVPNVLGMTTVEAEAALGAVNLSATYSPSQYSDVYAEGTVMSQSPTSGTDVEPNTEVTLILSAGVAVESAGLGGGLIMHKRRRTRRRKFRKMFRRA